MPEIPPSARHPIGIIITVKIDRQHLQEDFTDYKVLVCEVPRLSSLQMLGAVRRLGHTRPAIKMHLLMPPEGPWGKLLPALFVLQHG